MEEHGKMESQEDHKKVRNRQASKVHFRIPHPFSLEVSVLQQHKDMLYVP